VASPTRCFAADTPVLKKVYRIISDTGLNAEVERALGAVRAACTEPAQAIARCGRGAFLRHVSGRSPEPWWDQF
jgi:hypothetical protein